MKFKITNNIIEQAFPHTIIAKGISTDEHKGLNMTNSSKAITWVIVKGRINDWCVYTSLGQVPYETVKDWGDKVHCREHIENIAEFDDEVWRMYRH